MTLIKAWYHRGATILAMILKSDSLARVFTPEEILILKKAYVILVLHEP